MTQVILTILDCLIIGTLFVLLGLAVDSAFKMFRNGR